MKLLFNITKLYVNYSVVLFSLMSYAFINKLKVTVDILEKMSSNKVNNFSTK